jgi:hypothetical protein
MDHIKMDFKGNGWVGTGGSSCEHSNKSPGSIKDV